MVLTSFLFSFQVALAPISLDSSADSDLEVIGKAVGNARIVQLGELSHGESTTFRLKVRIAKYLHAKKGFDVLVWESGQAECEDINTLLAQDVPIVQAATMGVFSHWSQCKDSIKIFEYARETLKTGRPLRMFGFDIQTSGRRGNDLILDLIKRLNEVAELKSMDELNKSAKELKSRQPSLERENALLRLSRPLSNAIKLNRTTIKKAWGSQRLEEFERFANNFIQLEEMMASYSRYLAKPSFEEMKVGYDLRERGNAANIEWLANHRYKGKKLIIWAHNVHISHRGSMGQIGNETPQMESMGRIIKERLGKSIYTIGVVASSGKWSWLDNPTINLAPQAPGSIEEYLAKSGHDFGFIDLGSAQKQPGSPLARAMPGYINRQSQELKSIVWPKVFDGLLYIRKMEPRVSVGRKAPNT